MKYRKEVLLQHGQELDRFSQSKAYEALMDILEEDYKTSLFETTFDQPEQREEYYRRFQVLQDIKGTINALVHNARQEAEIVAAEEYDIFE